MAALAAGLGAPRPAGPRVDAGPLFSPLRPRRRARSPAARCACGRGVASPTRARAPRLAADRRRRRRLDLRRDLLHRGPVDGRGDPDPVAGRRRLPAVPAAHARRRARAAAQPHARRARHALGRRHHRRARRLRRQRRARLRDGARERLGPGARGRRQPRLPDRRPRPARRDRRRARRHRLAARPHLGAAARRRRHVLARRLALPRRQRQRHLRRRAPGSTPAGGSGWS